MPIGYSLFLRNKKTFEAVSQLIISGQAIGKNLNPKRNAIKKIENVVKLFSEIPQSTSIKIPQSAKEFTCFFTNIGGLNEYGPRKLAAEDERKLTE